MYEKYRIISFIHEVFVDERNLNFRFTEKSATHRDTDAFFFWFFLDLLGNQEKCDIRNLRAGNLQSLQKACALFVSDDDEVSFLEQFTERHFVFHLFDLE